MSTATETTAPFKLSKSRELSMPLALLVTILVASAVAYGRWSSTEEKVGRNSADIVEIKNEARQTREILIRIDENVKDLRRDARRTTP